MLSKGSFEIPAASAKPISRTTWDHSKIYIFIHQAADYLAQRSISTGYYYIGYFFILMIEVKNE